MVILFVHTDDFFSLWTRCEFHLFVYSETICRQYFSTLLHWRVLENNFRSWIVHSVVQKQEEGGFSEAPFNTLSETWHCLWPSSKVLKLKYGRMSRQIVATSFHVFRRLMTNSIKSEILFYSSFKCSIRICQRSKIRLWKRPMMKVCEYNVLCRFALQYVFTLSDSVAAFVFFNLRSSFRICKEGWKINRLIMPCGVFFVKVDVIKAYQLNLNVLLTFT